MSRAFIHADRKVPLFEVGALEGCWLAAVVVIPILFNVHSDTIFEPEKAAVLRSLFLVVVAVGVVGVFRGWRAEPHRIQAFWRTSVGIACTLTLGSYLLSTLTGIDPSLSFWGSYPRRQGMATTLALLGLFSAILLALRGRGQMDRLIGAMVLSTVPVAIYALSQKLGLDPIPWGWSVTDRPSGQAGNPVFLAAYVGLVVPLTLMLALRAAARWKRGVRGIRGTVPLLGLGTLLLLQAGVVLVSQSRGPMVGLGAGLALFALLALRRVPRRAAAAVVLVAVGSTGLFTMVVLPDGPLRKLRDAPALEWAGLHRFSEAFEVERGTQGVRLLLWDSMVELVTEDPTRLLLGYGPESIILTHHRHYRPGLSSLEGGALAADRAHNRTFDLLATRGVLGVLADSLLFLGILSVVLRGAGVLRGQKRVLLFGLSLVLGGGGGFLVSGSVGMWGLLGPLVPLGCVVGLLGFLAVDLFVPARSGGEGGAMPSLLPFALGSATLAHFVETQVGIETVTTRLFLWVMAGAVAVLGTGIFQEGDEGEDGASGVVKWGRVVALTMVTASFGFAGIPKPTRSVVPILIMVTCGSWLFGAFLGPWRGKRNRRAFVWASVPVFLALSGVQHLWPRSTGQYRMTGILSLEELLATVQKLSFTLPIFTGMVILVVILFGLTVPEPGRPPKARLLLSLWPLLLAFPALLGPLDPSRADVFAHVGKGYEAQRQWSPAAYLYQVASEREPGESVYLGHLARMNLEAARAETEPENRRRALDGAVRAASAAKDGRPQDPRYHRILGSIETEFGILVGDPETRSERFRRADQAFEVAVEAGPRVTATWVAWGRSLLRQGKPEEALERQAQAEVLDPDFSPAFHLKGESNLALGNWAGARDAFARAVELDPNHHQSWRGLGSAHAQLDARAEAVEAYLRAIEAGASDVLTFRNLALMLGELNRIPEAIPYAEKALDVAPPDVREEVLRLLEELREMSGAGSLE